MLALPRSSTHCAAFFFAFSFWKICWPGLLPVSLCTSQDKTLEFVVLGNTKKHKNNTYAFPTTGPLRIENTYASPSFLGVWLETHTRFHVCLGNTYLKTNLPSYLGNTKITHTRFLVRLGLYSGNTHQSKHFSAARILSEKRTLIAKPGATQQHSRHQAFAETTCAIVFQKNVWKRSPILHRRALLWRLRIFCHWRYGRVTLSPKQQTDGFVTHTVKILDLAN